MEARNGILQRIIGLERQLDSIEQQAAQRVGRISAVERGLEVQREVNALFQENIREDFREVKDDIKDIKRTVQQQDEKRDQQRDELRDQIIRGAWIVSFGLLSLAVAAAGILL